MIYGKYINYRTNNLPDGHPHKPIQINNKWENDDIRDILKVLYPNTIIRIKKLLLIYNSSKKEKTITIF